MHREYQPELLGAPGTGSPAGLAGESPRLVVLVASLATLIALDVLAPLLGWPRGVAGVSWAWIAAVLAAVRACYAVLDGLLVGRFGTDVALAQAAIAALLLREPLVAAEVVLISELGNLLESLAASRAYRALGRLFEAIPRTARVLSEGVATEKPIEQVSPGDLVQVAAGERIPVDGAVIEGQSTVDVSTLTGEPIPADVGPGDHVFTGCLNQFGVLTCRAEKIGADSTLGQVARIVRESQKRKAPIQRAADRYARWFLPVVQGAALLTIVAGLALGWTDTWRRVVSILVVACPCALVLATPAAVLASTAWLARRGVLIKGGLALERLARCDVIAFDKTGTLTLGRPDLTSVIAAGGEPPEVVLALAAGACASSRHPLSRAIVEEARRRGIVPAPARGVEERPGSGVLAEVETSAGEWMPIRIGSHSFVLDEGLVLPEVLAASLAESETRGETSILVSTGGRVLGLCAFADPIRDEAHDVVHELKHLGFKEVALLTGDRQPSAARVAGRVHIRTFVSEMRPTDKSRWIDERQAEGRLVAMVGDGINDAPALARAHVGIALAGPASDLAAEAGDIVMLRAPLEVLPDLVGISRATLSVIGRTSWDSRSD